MKVGKQKGRFLKANQCSDNKERLGDFYFFLQKARKIGKLVTVLCLGLVSPYRNQIPTKKIFKNFLTKATKYGIIHTSRGKRSELT